MQNSTINYDNQVTLHDIRIVGKTVYIEHSGLIIKPEKQDIIDYYVMNGKKLFKREVTHVIFLRSYESF